MTIEHTTRRGWTAGTDEAGGLVVRSATGRTWYPSLGAEVEAGGDLRRLVEIARRQGDRGTWG